MGLNEYLNMQQFQQLANQQNQYMQQSMGGLGAYIGAAAGDPIYFPPPELPKKPSKRSYIARLREEIDEWHGDILAA